MNIDTLTNGTQDKKNSFTNLLRDRLCGEGSWEVIKEELNQMYETGHGSVKMRASYMSLELKKHFPQRFLLSNGQRSWVILLRLIVLKLILIFRRKVLPEILSLLVLVLGKGEQRRF